MPVYFFWGEDDFTLNQAIKQLQQRVLDPAWIAFNFEKIAGDDSEATEQALNQAMTPPFGFGDRLVWVEDSNLGQQCTDPLLARLKATLPVIPSQNHLLFSSSKKPDGRLKSTKLLQEQGQMREFSLISPWRTDELVGQIQAIARDLSLSLTPQAEAFLAEALGNNTRQSYKDLLCFLTTLERHRHKLFEGTFDFDWIGPFANPIVPILHCFHCSRTTEPCMDDDLIFLLVVQLLFVRSLKNPHLQDTWSMQT